MNYVEYLIAAYAVFVLVLGWDFLATRLQIRRELRNARQRARRAGNAPPPDTSRRAPASTEPNR
jgi:heme exporter protein D